MSNSEPTDTARNTNDVHLGLDDSASRESSSSDLKSALVRVVHAAVVDSPSLSAHVSVALALVEALSGEPLSEAAATLLCDETIREFAFEKLSADAFDTKGVLYAIGTGFGEHEYVNPAEYKAVAVEFSADANNYCTSCARTPLSRQPFSSHAQSTTAGFSVCTLAPRRASNALPPPLLM